MQILTIKLLDLPNIGIKRIDPRKRWFSCAEVMTKGTMKEAKHAIIKK